MDEVDEIDENHVESNDAFAAYVTILYNIILRNLYGSYKTMRFYHTKSIRIK